MTNIDKNEKLKQVVLNLQELYPDIRMYTREHVMTASNGNPWGLTMFANKNLGLGKLTRLSHGSYVIPPGWTTGNAPWDIMLVAVAAKKKVKQAAAVKLATDSD